MTTRYPRPLSNDERAVLDLMLSADFAGVDALRLQAVTVVATGRCGCGCPSIHLQAPDDAPAAGGLISRLLPAEGRIRPVADEGPGQVIGFVDDGRLTYLEYVYYGTPPLAWPALDRIDIVR